MRPLIAALALLCAPLAAQEQVLYNFQSGQDGNNPYGAVIFDASGNLYATTELGGTDNEGTVFELSPASTGAWTEAQLFSFLIKCTGGICKSSTGNLPMSKLVFDSKGNLYGTTYEGGKYGNGTVFKLSPPAATGGAWTETVLHDFTGGSDGAIPLGGVALGKHGVLFGTAGGGGASNCGVAFALRPPAAGSTGWSEQVLHSFTCSPDGNEPQGELILDPSGNVYGTTFAGGTGNCFGGCGTIYQLTPPATTGGAWTETVLYSFLNIPDGVGPEAGLVRDAAGNFYGTTYAGGGASTGCFSVRCGTVFELSPPAAAGGAWKESILYSFTGGSDGGISLAALAIDAHGNLYGTTEAGGTACNCGVVFKVSPTSGGGWTEKVLHAFGGSPDGDSPQAAVTLHKGMLYGTARLGGANSLGVVFRVVP